MTTPLEETLAQCATWREQGKTIILCDGVFDILHAGHIAHLEESARAGDVLVVAIASDDYAISNGHAPLNTSHDRARVVDALSVVDMTCIVDSPAIIGMLRPDVYSKGQEYRAASADKHRSSSATRHLVESYGGKVMYTDTMMDSSSGIVLRANGAIPAATWSWLDDFALRWRLADVQEALDSIKDSHVVLLGERIEDTYCDVVPLIKSPRSFHDTCQLGATHTYGGGVAAINLQLEGYIAGMKTLHQQPVIEKVRFVHDGMKRFGVETIPCPLMVEEDERDVLNNLISSIRPESLLMVMDYGHGFFTQPIRDAIETLASKGHFLSINCQTNSANYGHNLASKYSMAAYRTMDEPEYDLAYSHSHDGGILASPPLPYTLTRGISGSTYYSAHHDPVHTPALAPKIVDRVGAGDALFAITTPLVARGCDPEMIGFIGNIMAGLHCGIVANERPITRKEIERYAKALLRH